MNLVDIATPALVLDRAAFDINVATMSQARPGARLRPHVKAFKSTTMARALSAAGHDSFCCATLREMEGMIDAGLGADLLLANETIDASRLRQISETADITVAIDSPETLRAAVEGRVHAVLLDINVGLPRCGCSPRDAARLAQQATDAGLVVRGVMGYEGHLMDWTDRDAQRREVERSMEILADAQRQIGGLTSAGGTGTFDMHSSTDEVQAGSYVMMDSHYAKVNLPFHQAAFVLATVISVEEGETSWYVANAGLKAFGMDHGNPEVAPGSVPGRVLFVSDEHTTVLCERHEVPAVGDHVWFVPAHIDPTVAQHERFCVVDSMERCNVIDSWDIDLRGW